MTGGAASDERIGGSVGRWIGSVLLVNFAIVCIVKVELGCPADILWLSHMGLLLAGAGLLTGSRLAVATAMTSLLVLHGLWLIDFLTWLAFGVFPIGATIYLEGAGGTAWLATAHHFYLAPLLVVWVRRQGRWPAEALLAAVALYLPLTVISRAALSPADNINYAFGVLTSWNHPLLDAINRLPGAIYMPGLNAFVATFMFLPAARLGRRLCRREGLDPRAASLAQWAS